MALLPITELETHDTGTEGVNAIINDNWRKIEAMFASGIFATLVDGMTTLTYGATVTLNIETSKRVAQCDLTGNAIIAIDGKAAGRWRILILAADASTRSLTWPSGVVWVNDALTSVPANETAMVFIVARSTTDASLVLFNANAAGAGGGGGTEPFWGFDEDDLAALDTPDDEDFAIDPGDWPGFAEIPVGRIDVIINQSRFASVGDGAKNKDCYFSADGGTTALNYDEIPTATSIHWMESVAGYQLHAATDFLAIRYNIASP